MRRHIVIGSLLLAFLSLVNVAKANTTLIARLSGIQEVPPVETTAEGLAIFTISTDNSTLSYKLVLNGAADISDVRLYNGSLGSVSSGVGLDLPANPTANHRVGALELTSLDQVNRLINGEMHVNVKTAAHPNGEIRGQIILPPPGTFVAELNGTQEVPPVDTNGGGVGIVSQGVGDGGPFIAYDLMIADVSNVQAAHIHSGALGEEGPVEFGLASQAFTRVQGVEPIDDTNAAALHAGNLYMNVHTQANPGGEVRGQLLPVQDSNVHLIPAPLTTIEPGGTATISVYVSKAHKLTAGGFVSFVTEPQIPVQPSINGIFAGQAALAAGGCEACVPGGDNTALATNPALTDDQGNPVGVAAPVKAAFLLPSGCEEGHLTNGSCEPGHETGGISGNFQELAQIRVTIPENATPGQTYQVKVGFPDFSNAASQRVPVVVHKGELIVRPSCEASLAEAETSVTVEAGASFTFHPVITCQDGSISWSFADGSPQLGSFEGNVYTAPSTVTGEQTVHVVGTLDVNPESQVMATIVIPAVTLAEGSNTAYRDTSNRNPKVGNFLVPTSGDDPATVEVEAGYPEDGRAVGNRQYFFNVEGSGLGATGLVWSVVAKNVAGLINFQGNPPYTQEQLDSLAGSVMANPADGNQGIYTPASASVIVPFAYALEITARSAADPGQSVTFHAKMLPYGDANLDGRVTGADFVTAFFWANGLGLPTYPEGADLTKLNQFVGVDVKRLLTDVKPIPGTVVQDALFNLWNSVYVDAGLDPLDKDRFDRDEFPFGNGAVSGSDAFWIFWKSVSSLGNPPTTFDPRDKGFNPIGF